MSYHIHATLLLQQGESPLYVKEQMGTPRSKSPSTLTGISFQGGTRQRWIGSMNLWKRPDFRRKPQPLRNRRPWVESPADPKCLILCGAPGRN